MLPTIQGTLARRVPVYPANLRFQAQVIEYFLVIRSNIYRDTRLSCNDQNGESNTLTASVQYTGGTGNS